MSLQVDVSVGVNGGLTLQEVPEADHALPLLLIDVVAPGKRCERLHRTQECLHEQRVQVLREVRRRPAVSSGATVELPPAEAIWFFP